MASLRQVLQLFESRAGRQLSVELVAESTGESFSEASRVIRILWARSLLDAGGLRGLERDRAVKYDQGERIRDLTFGITEYGRRRVAYWRGKE